VIERVHRLTDRAVESTKISEGLVGEMMRFQVAPDEFDVVQFRRILWQPLDGEPVRAGCEGGQRELAGVDRTIVLDQHHRPGGLPGLGAIQPVELLEMGDKVAASLSRAGMDDELARDISSEPSMATFLACPGAGTRRSAPTLAQARAR